MATLVFPVPCALVELATSPSRDRVHFSLFLDKQNGKKVTSVTLEVKKVDTASTQLSLGTLTFGTWPPCRGEDEQPYGRATWRFSGHSPTSVPDNSQRQPPDM